MKSHSHVHAAVIVELALTTLRVDISWLREGDRQACNSYHLSPNESMQGRGGIARCYQQERPTLLCQANAMMKEISQCPASPPFS